MSRATTRIVAAVTAAMIAGLGLTSPTVPASAADFGEDVSCAGMSATANTAAGNRAPVAVNDNVGVVAGGTVAVKVLTNDTDPDGDALFVQSTSKPRRGEVCAQSNGSIEFTAASSATNYNAFFTYGITDGDYYRTATVTVHVVGVKPLRAQLQHRLVLAKHNRKSVKRAAVVGLTNSNNRSLLVLAGDPNKSRAQVQTVLAAGRSITFRTRSKSVLFFAVLKDATGDSVIVGIGALNTVNGVQTVIAADGERTGVSDQAVPQRWLHR